MASLYPEKLMKAARPDAFPLQWHLELAVEAAQLGLWSYDIRTGEVTWSARCKAIYGLPEDAPITYEGFLRALHPEDRPGIEAALQAAMESGADYRVEKRILRPDGSVRWTASLGRCFTDEAGHPLLLAGATMDITDRKAVEEALRQSREDLDHAQEVGQIGSWRLNIRTGELSWSDEAHRIFGIQKGTPLNYQSFLSAVYQEDRGYVDECWQAALAGEPYDIEHRICVAGEVKWVREKASLEFDERGHLLGGFGITQDISRCKEIEEALRRSDTRKDEFLAMLSHELRNPLVPIRNAVEILRDQSRLSEEQVAASLLFIDRQVEHMSRLLDDLLDVTRISMGRVELRHESLDVTEIIQRAVETSRPLVESRRHQLQVKLPTRPVRIRGDSVRLAQVISNLLNNAAKYTDPGGQIFLDSGCEAGSVVIRVRDNGRGIAPEVLPHVFELFYQGDLKPSGGEGGLGVGLSLVRRLVQLHGGSVEACSEGSGRGSEFVVRLPEVGHRREKRRDQRASSPAARRALRVLVVDDCRDIVESLSMLLTLKGYEVLTADDGPAAIDIALVELPQVILLDIGLPGMTGYEVARELRRRRELDGTWLIAVSGYGQPKDLEMSRDAGFDHHLVKPVEFSELQQILAGYPLS